MQSEAEGIGVAFREPTTRLTRYVSGYHCYTIAPTGDRLVKDVFFPAWANIRFSIDAAPWWIRIGDRRFDPVPARALFGPTSHAGYIGARAGRLIGAGLTPLGWARLIGGDASTIANRVVPLDAVLAEAAALETALAEAADPFAELEAYLLQRLEAAPPEDAMLPAILEGINDPAIIRVDQLAARTGFGERLLVQRCKRAFGFTPKLLLRRARFLRALVRLENPGEISWTRVAADAGYFDGSHFLKDCNHFIGCSPSAFLAMPRPLNRASQALRRKVLGGPMQALHQPTTTATSPSSAPPLSRERAGA